MEYGTLEREIAIDAPPATVFEVITSPEHLTNWWPDEAELEATPGSVGRLTFGEPGAAAHTPRITVIEVEPARRFSFRWGHPDSEDAHAGNSLLVTFELSPRGAGTVLRMTETGFRQQGWEVAVLEARYADHGAGWDHYLPRLASYAPTVEVVRG